MAGILNIILYNTTTGYNSVIVGKETKKKIIISRPVKEPYIRVGILIPLILKYQKKDCVKYRILSKKNVFVSILKKFLVLLEMIKSKYTRKKHSYNLTKKIKHS